MASAGVVDAQSVKGADTVGVDSRGFDAGKKVNGRKRHIVVDTLGLLRFVMPSVAHIWADGGYAGRLVAYARKVLRRTVEIVARTMISAASRCWHAVG